MTRKVIAASYPGVTLASSQRPTQLYGAIPFEIVRIRNGYVQDDLHELRGMFQGVTPDVLEGAKLTPQATRMLHETFTGCRDEQNRNEHSCLES